ncbi:hypothetical protein G6K93_07695 [Agrobacterium rhizogenes]|nr:hypothetical protein [Rhizobium rhizogenes]
MTIEAVQSEAKLLTFGCPRCRDEQKLIAQYWFHAVCVSEDVAAVIIPDTIRCPYCRRVVPFNLPSGDQK